MFLIFVLQDGNNIISGNNPESDASNAARHKLYYEKIGSATSATHMHRCC